MKAVHNEFTKLLAAEAQFCVPIYQRKYSWKKKNCVKLLSDIIQASKDTKRPCHFIGSVIYMASDDSQHASALKEYLVIDGQQRLTTLSILLLALSDYTKRKIPDAVEYGKAVTHYDKISRRYLINEYETGDMYYKVRLNEEDFYAYKKLINKREKPDDIKNSKIFENYSILYKAMVESKESPQVIFDGIKKLMLVDICLVPEDNAQLVFETVNSTGLPLSTADKIRNFLLMTVEPSKQTQLYTDYWHPMEKDLGMESGNTNEFENFFNYYMTAVMKKQLVGDYYEQFKDYYTDNVSVGTETIVRQIRQYSKFYKRWKEATTGRIDGVLAKVRKTGQFKITPAVLTILASLEENDLTEDDAIAILTMIESYWMRRTMCALPTNTAGPVCLTMLKSLDAPDTFRTAIENLTWAQRMPKDDEVINTLKTLKIYSLSSPRTKTILDTLENNKRKEYIPTKEYTIEHIMPQTLSDNWKTNLGTDYETVHNTYLHTLGNLTLTGYNSEYQNKCFIEKMEYTDKDGNKIGYRHTPIKISSYLTNQTVWGKDQILARTERLANELIQIWKYPK